MQVILIILFVVWLIGMERIGRKYSKETLSSLFGFKPAETTFKGYVYIGLWTVGMFFIIGLLGMAAGY
jgi:hypothetical protein